MPRKTVRSQTAAMQSTAEAATATPSKPTPPKPTPARAKAPAKPTPARAKAPAKPTAKRKAEPAAKADPPSAAGTPPPPPQLPESDEPKVAPPKVAPKRAGPKRTQFDEASLASIRKALSKQRADLVRQLSDIEDATFNLSQSEMSGEVGFDEDSADAGSFTFEREKDLSIANNVSDLRSKIDRALRQIEEGSYGICVSCGQAIEGPRLKALPHVTLCLKCKKLEERR